MKKLITLAVLLLSVSITSFALGPIYGPTSCCIGSTIYLTDSLYPGGTWTSSAPGVATVGSSTGVVTGVSAGTATITYTLSGSYVTSTVTVSAAPAPIGGGTTAICPGATTTLTDAVSGGTWTSYNTGIATVGSASGIVTGVAGGTATIGYSIASGCNVYVTVTVVSSPSSAIAGPSTVCLGSTIALTDSVSMFGGGTWSSSNTAIATVGTSGVVTGVSVGSAIISLAYTNSCGITTYSTHMVTVLNTTSAGTISGPSSVSVGNTITLTNPYSSSGSFSWTSSNPSVATIGASSGVVTGVSVGSTVITYGVTGCGGLATTTATVNVVSLDGISGYVNFSSSFYGQVKVWLINFNPSTNWLSASDSATVYCSGSSVYYQFTGLATDSFRIKAALADSSGYTLTTGYLPTYHNSHFYWHDADVIYHTAGTSDINEDVNMITGTTSTGPGFIQGDVTTGANKGTSGAVPVVGLKMCVINAATNQMMGAAFTNTSGAYTFNNLPVGQTYYVFPDSMNYLTTPYTGITLTSSTPSMSAANFIQHTNRTPKSITPVLAGVNNVSSAVATLFSYPNPTTGMLNIRWYETADENAAVSIADITGREVYGATLKMTEGAGAAQLDLSGVANGLYIVSIRSGNFNYTNKIQVQH